MATSFSPNATFSPSRPELVARVAVSHADIVEKYASILPQVYLTWKLNDWITINSKVNNFKVASGAKIWSTFAAFEIIFGCEIGSKIESKNKNWTYYYIYLYDGIKQSQRLIHEKCPIKNSINLKVSRL